MAYGGLRLSTMVYEVLQWSTNVYNGLQRFIMVYKGLGWSTKVYDGLQRFTMVSEGLRWSTKVYGGLPWSMPYSRCNDMANESVWVFFEGGKEELQHSLPRAP